MQTNVVKQAESSQHEAPCADGEYNNKSDLCAQWYAARAARDAADWGFWTLWVGIGSLVLSAGGLFVVYVSLRHTRKALRHAWRANQISEQTARTTLRAYVGGADFRIENFFVNETPVTSWILKNYGNTIARDVELIAAAFVEPSDRECIRFNHTFRLKRDLLPGEEWPCRYFWPWKPSQEGVEAFNEHHVSFIYAGVIRYRDGFGARRYTTFKMKVGKQYLNLNTGSGPLLNCIRGNRSN